MYAKSLSFAKDRSHSGLKYVCEIIELFIFIVITIDNGCGAATIQVGTVALTKKPAHNQRKGVSLMAKTDIIIPPKTALNAILQAPKNEKISATALWKACGKPANKRPFDFMVTEYAQELIVSLHCAATGESKELYPFEHKKSLPLNVTENYVQTYLGKGGGTFMTRQVLLRYAGWLDVEMAKIILKCFEDYGTISMEENPEKKTRLLVDKAMETSDQIEASIPKRTIKDHVGGKRRSQARIKGIMARNNFSDAVQLITGLEGQALGSVISKITGHINKALFGMDSTTLAAKLGGSRGLPIREHMTVQYQNGLAAIERTCTRKLMHYMEENQEIDYQDLFKAIDKTATAARELIFIDDMGAEPLAENMKLRKSANGPAGLYEVSQEKDYTTHDDFTAKHKLLGDEG